MNTFRRFCLKGVLGLTFLASIAAWADDAALTLVDQAPANGVWLDSLDLSKMTQQFRTPHARHSLGGNPIRLGGVVFPHGVGTHAQSELFVELGGEAVHFVSMAGVDDEVGRTGSVEFEVWVDGVRKATSGHMSGGDPAHLFSVDLIGAHVLHLVVSKLFDGHAFDHADWAGALILVKPGAKTMPVTRDVVPEPAMPIASRLRSETRINAPHIAGTTPGRPFVFKIPASGEGPLHYRVSDLPKGLTLDAKTGIIAGSLEEAGRFVTTVSVKGPKGSDTRALTIVGGDHKLALTPPMGWNSWNVWAKAIDDAKVRAAADAMVNTGLAAHGYQYINIDDCWQGTRDENGVLHGNERFPDMKALADYIHSKGLRFGIYSSPGPVTCTDYVGSYGYESIDAKTWASWGVDYVKYDWCSYAGSVRDPGVPEFQQPYRVLRAALDACDRDIVYSLCQYGWGKVWTWGAEVGANLWRTTGDINDEWNSVAGIGFDQAPTVAYAGPGHWNDPDMLVVGKLGWGANLHSTRLAPNEQIMHITLWSLLAAPLLLGCDLNALDPFTLDLLSNDEVIEVDQDPLGIAARRIQADDTHEIWARPLSDGTLAVGLFNRGCETMPITVTWSDLGLTGPQPVRDLWQRKNIGVKNDSLTLDVRIHGAALLKIGLGR